MQSRFIRRILLISFLSLVLTFYQAAWAHPGHGGSFSAGLLHPLTGWDHLLAMTAVGLWASQLQGRLMVVLPLSFIAFMALGAGLGMAGIQVPCVESGTLASVLVLGIAIAMAFKPPIPAVIAFTGFCAVFHGYAHFIEKPFGQPVLFYGLGFLLTTLVLHLFGIALGSGLSKNMSSATIRWAGAFTALAGTTLWLTGWS